MNARANMRSTRARQVWARVGAAILTASLAGAPACGARHIEVVGTESVAPGVRVVVERTDANIVKLLVVNEGNEAIVIHRDRVRLRTSRGVRARMPGGGGTVFDAPPGGSHKLYVRFDVEDLPPGEKVEVLFDGVVERGGQPVTVPPLAFAVGQ